MGAVCKWHDSGIGKRRGGVYPHKRLIINNDKKISMQDMDLMPGRRRGRPYVWNRLIIGNAVFVGQGSVPAPIENNRRLNAIRPARRPALR
jgi:hypothetical protein